MFWGGAGPMGVRPAVRSFPAHRPAAYLLALADGSDSTGRRTAAHRPQRGRWRRRSCRARCPCRWPTATWRPSPRGWSAVVHRFVVGGDINAARRFDVIYNETTYRKFFASVVERRFHDCHFGLHGKEERTFWGEGRVPARPLLRRRPNGGPRAKVRGRYDRRNATAERPEPTRPRAWVKSP
jgi:hypothetical protein